jgi:radical SAM protein with 4Fe4S-binding SPASM domain
MITVHESKDQSKKDERTLNLMKIIKEKRLISLILEPTSLCNLSCKFCYPHRQGVKVKKGSMSLGLYERILDEIEHLDFRFETIFFHGNGEPLMNKHIIIDMIKMAVNRELARKYVIFTNGTLMYPDTFDRLVASGINEINISLDTIIPEVYEKFKGKDLLSEVLSNIDYAIEQILKTILKTPSVTLVIKSAEGGSSYGLDDKNLQDIINKYKDVAVNSSFIHVKNVPVVRTVDGMMMKMESKEGKECHDLCELPFYTILIKHDGRVSPCCADVFDDISIGKIGNKSLKEILNGPRLREIRKVHLSGNLKDLPLCMYCQNRTVVDLSGSERREELSGLL